MGEFIYSFVSIASIQEWNHGFKRDAAPPTPYILRGSHYLAGHSDSARAPPGN